MTPKPSGEDLLATLIALYADQEGVKITYSLAPAESNKRST